jgi:hypothetical protein
MANPDAPLGGDVGVVGGTQERHAALLHVLLRRHSPACAARHAPQSITARTHTCRACRVPCVRVRWACGVRELTEVPGECGGIGQQAAVGALPLVGRAVDCGVGRGHHGRPLSVAHCPLHQPEPRHCHTPHTHTHEKKHTDTSCHVTLVGPEEQRRDTYGGRGRHGGRPATNGGRAGHVVAAVPQRGDARQPRRSGGRRRHHRWWW